ncbi:Uncharacterized protein BP5553_09585 [Venustampulla echinocandica]|uniref:BD-FAE-like domain-containing protein n=1 Tax=Venustampulla echinocandica TaxID=2656787 RepID=A0A370TBG7_9HELO|nr:Uncharacterized protein BP5553_09585 [Venustampulla echinocandica]RDL31376.1 Uncharacterized protein BP5553_09585 [Venustampulla echinocandica]
MEAIAQFPSKDIASILLPTLEAFKPLLEANDVQILSVPRTTYSYGPHERQTLDLYSEPTSSPYSPLIVFFYGGGLNRGDRILPFFPSGLVYHNLGTFFAQRGFTAIVADYRRVNDATIGTGDGAVFPSGGEDVGAVVDWLESSHLLSDQASKPRDLFLMGNSAGGVHVSTYLLDPRFEKQRRIALAESGAFSLRGAVLVSVPLDFKTAQPTRFDVLRAYWPPSLSDTRKETSHDDFCPNGLLRSCRGVNCCGLAKPQDLSIPDVLVMLGELDPEDEILESNERFLEYWEKVFGSRDGVEVKWMKGQNHISPPIALMSGDKRGEEWAEEVIKWTKRFEL